jgi:hypothetical protein
MDFNQNTPDQQIYHNPTKGRTNEREKFKIYYNKSESRYQKRLVFLQPMIFGIIDGSVGGGLD